MPKYQVVITVESDEPVPDFHRSFLKRHLVEETSGVLRRFGLRQVRRITADGKDTE